MAAPEPYTVDWFASRLDGQWTKMQHAWALDELLHPKSVIDVGCASGGMLLWWARYRPDVFLVGVEKYAVEAREVAESVVEPFILEGDICEPGWWGWFNHFDLAVCVEVAEHVEPGCEHNIVAGLGELSENIFFTAATPGQKGAGHVNCRPHAFWENMFAERGYERDREIVKRWRALVPKGRGKMPRKNAMFFRRTS